MFLKKLSSLRGLGYADGEYDAYTSDAPSWNEPAVNSFPSVSYPSYDSPATVYPAPRDAASVQPPTQGTNWTGAITEAIKAWGQIGVAEQQAKAAAANPYARYGAYLPGYTGLPGSSPFPGLATPGTIFGLPSGMVILGAVAVGAFFLLKD